MPLKVKYDIGTSVSIDVVIGTNPNDQSDVEQAQILLPGAIVPPNVAPRIVEGVRAGDPWYTRLLEFDEGIDDIAPATSSPLAFREDAQVLSNPFEAASQVGDGDQPFDGSNAPVPASAPAAPAAEPDPTGQTASSPFFDGVNATTPENEVSIAAYADNSKAELEAEVAKRKAAGRQLTVEGTGQNGGVRADDLRLALAKDDAAATA